MKILFFALFLTASSLIASQFAWTSHQLPGSEYNISNIHYANGRFVAIGARLTLYSSADGKNWTAGLITAVPDFSFDSFFDLSGVAYGNGTWVVLGTKIANPMVLRSTDGVNWTASEPTNLPRPTGLSFSNGIFYAADRSDDGIHTSTNGLTWTKAISTPKNAVLAVEGPNGFAIALSGGTMHYSSNLSTLQGPVHQTPSASVFRHVGFHNGRFIASDEFTQTYHSTDGINWQTFSGQFPRFHEAFGIIYTQVGYLAATRISTNANGFIMCSNDAKIWKQEYEAPDSFYSIACGNGTVVAGANDGVVYTGVPASSQVRRNDDGSLTVAFPTPQNTPVTLRSGSNLDTSTWQNIISDTPSTGSFSITLSYEPGTRFFQLSW